MRVDCDQSIQYELKSHFTFKVPGYQHMPKYRAGMWDGNISLFNLKTKQIYAGLIYRIAQFAKDNKYSIKADDYYAPANLDRTDLRSWMSTLGIPSKFELRDYQIESFIHSVDRRRALIVSPTASGKSLIIYLILRWYLSLKIAPALLIVPTTSLIHQMYTDFEDYGYNSEKYVQKIYQDQEQDIKKPIIVSTWQSIYDNDKKWFKPFQVVIGDEAHQYKATSLKTIMENLVDTRYRIGTTGTLDGTITNKMVLEGLFGTVKQYTTTRQLMKEKILAQLSIKIIIFKYTSEISRAYSKVDYNVEKDFIVGFEKRNEYIKRLALTIKGNTLILYQLVDKHGQLLYNLISSAAKGSHRKVWFIHGKVDGEDRDEIRAIVEKEKDAIIVASYGTFSTGVNIKNLNNVITASPSKSKIRVLQSIGRGLRISETKDSVSWYDLADDLHWKKQQNHTLKHLLSRIQLYNSEGFDYKTYNVSL